MTMRRKRILRALLTLCLFVPLPALLAPHVSADPARWAYRVYHPLMYRYPAVLHHEALRNDAGMSWFERSLSSAELVIKLW